MTYSIVAHDPATQRWAVAVQSCVFAVGTRVPAVHPSGAVAVQAGSPSWYRQPALEMLARGAGADDVVAALRALPRADVGQFGVVDAAGRAAAHTGPECTAAAGHAIGDGVLTAGNLVERDGMWQEMLHAYSTSGGSFEARLLAALQAAEATGGDVRGRQSAAMVITAGNRADGTALYETELRVDDHVDPVGELGRLLRVKAAHDGLRRALADGADGDWTAAADRLVPLVSTAPDDALVTVWTGITLALAGREDHAAPHLAAALRQNPRWVSELAREPALSRPEDRNRVLGLVHRQAAVLAGEGH